MLAEVEDLLELEEESDGFLSGLPQDSLKDLELLVEPEIGRQAGPYRLLERLGGGGMGAVYLAERTNGPQQRVAVKILRAGLFSPASVARFRREQAALARLAHDRIARFLDAGCLEDGRPFLVLELVEGEPLDRYCDSRRLAIEARLRLFSEICAAVEFVHQHLVVHRDLKPANLLVTAEGVPKLLDFGISKCLDGFGPFRRTETAAGPMTLQYASPEQVRGEPVGTATDVYSLGVILYELLCGHSPYRLEDGSRFATEKAILEQEPERPSAVAARSRDSAEARRTHPRSLARMLRGDLDAIVLRALRKRSADRYASVSELRRDVSAYLERQPVAARRGNTLYGLGKWISRHRTAVATLAVLAGATVTFLLQLFFQGERLRAERDRTRRVLDVLVETFQSPDPYGPGDATLTARDLLLRAEAVAAEDLRTDPALEAPLLRAIGKAYLGLGFVGDAEPLLLRAATLDPMNEGSRRALGAESLLALAALRARQGRESEALEYASSALASLRGDRDSPPRLLSEALQSAGTLTPHIEDSRRLHEEALWVSRQAFGDGSYEAALARAALARSLGRLGHWDEAKALFESAVQGAERAVGTRSPRLSSMLSSQGLMLLDAGEVEAARARFERARQIDLLTLGEDHPDALERQLNIALTRMHERDFAGAEASFRQLLPRMEAKCGSASVKVASLLHDLAWSIFCLGRPAEATQFNRRALSIFRQRLGQKSERTAASLRQLGMSEFAETGKLEPSLEKIREAVQILEEVEGPNSPTLVKLVLDMGQLAMLAHELDLAEATLRTATERSRRIFPAMHDTRLIAELELAKALTLAGKHEEAEALLLASFGAMKDRGLESADWRIEACCKRLKSLYEGWGFPEKLPSGCFAKPTLPLPSTGTKGT